MRLCAWGKTKLLPPGIRGGDPATPAPPRPPPRPPALRVSSVIGCFWANAQAARRTMLNFVMVAIVAIWRGTARACAAGGPRAGATADGAFPARSFQFARERRQRRQQTADHLLRLLVGQIALGVATLPGQADHHLRLVEGVHVQKHKALAQVILCARRPHHSRRGPHDGDRLARPRVIAVRARCPVDGVLEYAGNGVVIFGRGNQNRVCRADARFEFGDDARRLALVVLVVRRNAQQVEETPSGVSCCAARRSPRLMESLRRLPQIPRTVSGVSIPHWTTSKNPWRGHLRLPGRDSSRPLLRWPTQRRHEYWRGRQSVCATAALLVIIRPDSMLSGSGGTS